MLRHVASGNTRQMASVFQRGGAHGSEFVAEMLLLFLAGVGLALGVLGGRPLRGGALIIVIGFALLVTITVTIALFIARPGRQQEPSARGDDDRSADIIIKAGGIHFHGRDPMAPVARAPS